MKNWIFNFSRLQKNNGTGHSCALNRKPCSQQRWQNEENKKGNQRNIKGLSYSLKVEKIRIWRREEGSSEGLKKKKKIKQKTKSWSLKTRMKTMMIHSEDVWTRKWQRKSFVGGFSFGRFYLLQLKKICIFPLHKNLTFWPLAFNQACSWLRKKHRGKGKKQVVLFIYYWF